MPNFFKSDTPERLAKAERDILQLRAEALVDRENFNHAIDELEQNFEGRLKAIENASPNSLNSAAQKKADDQPIGKGYTPWTTRKQQRIQAAADPEALQKRALKAVQHPPKP